MEGFEKKPPEGKFMFGAVKVGERGQIVIPKDAREVFNIKPGDSLVVLGDVREGLAMIKSEKFFAVLEKIKNEGGSEK